MMDDQTWAAINDRLTALHGRKLAIANGPDASGGMSLALACEADGIEDALATLAAYFGRTVTWPDERDPGQPDGGPGYIPAGQRFTGGQPG
jgi:hypothetical protein